MTSKPKAAITGVAGYVPPYVLTNKELETMVDTNDEWIVTRTGVRERRIQKAPAAGVSDLLTPAVKELHEKTNTRSDEVDLLICCTISGDLIFPATANIICGRIGATNAFGYDLGAACSGFLYGMATGAAFIESGRYKKVIVAGADVMSGIVDYTDRKTCVIFGDGGGAIMLEPNQEFGIEDFILRSDGTGEAYLHMKAGGSRRPPSHETIDQKMHYVYQEGATVYKFAVSNMTEVAAQMMERHHLTADDLAWLVPHQANKRIIEATANRTGMPLDKVMINIDRYGNTTNGTLPLCLTDYESQLKKGDKLLFAAFGGGFTWGSLYLTWAY